jgi:hypothetical protein
MTDHQITEAMIVFGGSFVSGLGKLYRQADADNKATLKAAFPALWVKYSDPAMHTRLAQMSPEWGWAGRK